MLKISICGENNHENQTPKLSCIFLLNPLSYDLLYCYFNQVPPYLVPLQLIRLGGSILKLLGVLLPDGVEDPVIVPRVVPSRRLAILLPDKTRQQPLDNLTWRHSLKHAPLKRAYQWTVPKHNLVNHPFCENCREKSDYDLMNNTRGQTKGPNGNDLRVRLIVAGFLPRLLCFPPLVLVHQLWKVGCLLGVPDDQLVFQQLFGSWPLRRRRVSSKCKYWMCSTLASLHNVQRVDFLERRPLSEWQFELNFSPNTTYKAGLFVQTGFYEFFEGFAVVSFQGGRVVLWDDE